MLQSAILPSSVPCILRRYYTGINGRLVGTLRRRLSQSTTCCRNCSTNHYQGTSTKSMTTMYIRSRQYATVIRKQHHSTSAATASSTITIPTTYSCPSFVVTQQRPQQVVISSSMTATTSTPIHTSMPTTQMTTVIAHQNTLLQEAAKATTTTTAAATASTATMVSENKVALSDLRALFIASSIPMIGFGFMDQFVLIQAGGYIDATFGISFGLATLSAAAAGQVVSDVSGVVFGGALERFLSINTSWLRTPNITQIQRQLPICRNVALAGAIVGVIIGCALGATSLLFVDLEARNRMERAQRLREIVSDMIYIPSSVSSTTTSTTTTKTGTESNDVISDNENYNNSLSDDNMFQCESCTVYVVSTKDLTLPSDKDTSFDQEKVQLKDFTSMRNTSSSNNDERNDYDIDAVQRCIASKAITLSDDRRNMYVPVIRRNTSKSPTHEPTMNRNVPEDILAVVAFRYGNTNDDSDTIDDRNKHNINDNNNNDIVATKLLTGYYNDEDIVTARVMSRHIAIFMDR
jgi:hypothetical protein